MAIDFLTLSMTETDPSTGEFAVHAMDLKDGKIYCLKIDKDKIISKNGTVFWDIGKVSRTDYLEDKSYNKNIIFAPGPTVLQSRTINLKEQLEDSISTYKHFDLSPQIFEAVVKVKSVEDLSYIKESKSYLTVRFPNMPEPEKILNKDYRWLAFWKHVPAEQLEETKNRYLTMLNKSGKNLYLMMYRYNFKPKNGIKQKPGTWISGMHWL